MGRHRWGWYLAAGAPALVPLIMILRYGVNFHYFDEWMPDMAGALIKAHNGQLTLGDILAQHNEHRPAVMRLIWVALDPITHWNNVAYLVVAWAMVAATSGLVLLLIRKTQARAGAAVIWFLCNLLIFSPAQHENWLWGMGLTNFLPAFFFMAMVVIAISKRSIWVRVICCLPPAVLAFYSLGNGILAWPLGGLLLVWPRGDSSAVKRFWAGVIWAIGGAGTIYLYYHGYHRPTFGASPYIRTFPAISIWTLAFAGSPFPHWQPAGVETDRIVFGGAIMAGVAAAVVYAFLKPREVSGRMLPWIVVAGFGLLSGVSAAFFRAGFGPEQAVSSRYVSSAIYVSIGLINLVAIVAEGKRFKLAKVGLAGALIASQVLFFPGAMEIARGREIRYRLGKGALLLLNVVPHTPESAYIGVYEPPGLVETANALSEIGDVRPPLLTSNNAALIARRNDGSVHDVAGAIDGFDRRTAAQVRVRGWAIFPKVPRAATCVFLTYRDAAGEPIIFAAAQMRFRRDDLAAIIPEGELRICGWEAIFDPGEIPAAIQSTFIEAWVLDEDTGRATPLDRPVLFHR